MRQLTDAEDARRTVEYWIEEGSTSFKAYTNITPDELAAAVKAAHGHGLKVTGNLCSIGFREAAALGINDLEHGLFVDTEFFPGKKPDQCPDGPSAAEKSLQRRAYGNLAPEKSSHTRRTHAALRQDHGGSVRLPSSCSGKWKNQFCII
jgi:imidazolonepropionase-like amidohydrolase